jgi:hypothetical protein
LARPSAVSNDSSRAETADTSMPVCVCVCVCQPYHDTHVIPHFCAAAFSNQGQCPSCTKTPCCVYHHANCSRAGVCRPPCSWGAVSARKWHAALLKRDAPQLVWHMTHPAIIQQTSCVQLRRDTYALMLYDTCLNESVSCVHIYGNQETFFLF